MYLLFPEILLNKKNKQKKKQRFSLPKQSRSLDPSYNIDLDFWWCFGKVTPSLLQHFRIAIMSPHQKVRGGHIVSVLILGVGVTVCIHHIS